jgi:hypothetical protein
MGKNVNDFLNLLIGKSDEVLTGSYYPKRPKTARDVSIKFGYDIVNDSDISYSKILDNVKTEQSILTIKTNDVCGFSINGYVVTQDGDMWQITGIIKRIVVKENKQALRFLKETPATEYVMRLIGVENPMGLK